MPEDIVAQQTRKGRRVLETGGRTLEQLMDLVRERAAHDREFKALCLSSPKEAILACVGVDVPDGISVEFAESKDGLEIMAMADAGLTGVLSDQDLDYVAGGGAKDFCSYDPSVRGCYKAGPRSKCNGFYGGERCRHYPW